MPGIDCTLYHILPTRSFEDADGGDTEHELFGIFRKTPKLQRGPILFSIDSGSLGRTHRPDSVVERPGQILRAHGEERAR